MALRHRSRVHFLLALLAISLIELGPFVGGVVGQASSEEALALYAEAAGYQNNNQFDLAATEWRRYIKDFASHSKATEVRYKLAVCEIQEDEFEIAVRHLEQVIAAANGFKRLGDAYLNLGLARYSLAGQDRPEEFERATSAFTTALDQYPGGDNRDQALFFRGESLYQQGKRREAVASYVELLQKHANSDLRIDAMYAMGVAHEELAEYARAGQTFDKFLESFPEHDLVVEVRMRRAETILQAGKFVEAEKMFASVAATEGFHAADHARYRQAFCLAQQKRYTQAGKVFGMIVDETPESAYAPDAAIAAGRAFYRANDFDAAAKWFQRVEMTDSPHVPEAAHWHARILLDRDKPQEARELLAAVLPTAEDHPFLVDLKMDDADALYEQNDTRKVSISAYLKIAVEHDDHPLAAKALYNAAFGALEVGDYHIVLDSANRFLAKYDKHALRLEVQKLLAECLLQLGQHEAAAKAYAALAASGAADGTRFQLRRGLSLYLQETYDAAIGVLSDVLATTKSQDEKAEAAYWIGRSFAGKKEYDQAIKALEASQTAKPNWRQADEVLLHLARALHYVNRTGDAKSTVTKLISTYPTSEVLDQAHYRLAEFSYASTEYPAAVNHYSKVIEGWPRSKLIPFSLYGRGWSHLRSKHPRKAAVDFDHLLESYADHELADQTRHARARARHQAGDYRAAIADIEAFLGTNTDMSARSDALHLRGLCHAGLKDQAAAIIAFQASLDANPKYASADKVYYELAWAHKNAEDNAAALSEFQTLVEQWPKSPHAAEAHYHIGEDLYARKEYDAAAKEFELAESVAGTNDLRVKTIYKLGWSQFQASHIEKALASFSKQLDVNNSDTLAADAEFMRGECLFKLKRYEDALLAYEKAKAHPSKSETMQVLTYLHAGQAAAQLNRWKESLRWISELTREFPQSAFLPQATYEQAWAHRNLGELDVALQLFTQVTKANQSPLGARARFMMGEIRFEMKDFNAAIDEFRRVMYGYGAENAPQRTKRWQAKSAFEAGRCASVLAGQQSNPQKRAEHLKKAHEFFRYVVEKHPQSDEADAARQQLQRLSA